jgi:hypothetical protein
LSRRSCYRPQAGAGAPGYAVGAQLSERKGILPYLPRARAKAACQSFSLICSVTRFSNACSCSGNSCGGSYRRLITSPMCIWMRRYGAAGQDGRSEASCGRYLSDAMVRGSQRCPNTLLGKAFGNERCSWNPTNESQDAFPRPVNPVLTGRKRSRCWKGRSLQRPAVIPRRLRGVGRQLDRFNN